MLGVLGVPTVLHVLGSIEARMVSLDPELLLLFSHKRVKVNTCPIRALKWTNGRTDRCTERRTHHLVSPGTGTK